jgi:hypothetical protein
VAVLLLVTIFKALSELLALCLVGQGALWLLAGHAREQNLVYRMFAAVTRPVMRMARWLMPRFVLDRHIWLVALLIVLLVWIVAGQQKLRICVGDTPNDPLCADLVKQLHERKSKP